MEVFIVVSHQFNDAEVLGVFATRELAEKIAGENETILRMRVQGG